MPFLLFALLILGITAAVPGPGAAESLQDQLQKGDQGPIVIRSKTLEMNDARKVVIFEGAVDAKRGDFKINCRKMVVHYESASQQKEGAKTEAKINKIVSTGDVKILRDQGGLATAEKAVYYQADETLVLTGKPIVRKGNDSVEGDRIIIFLRENRSVVEGSEDKKVKAVIFPGKDKKGGP